MSYLLDRGANASIQDAFGTTPLCEAVKKNRMGVVGILIEANAELGLKVLLSSPILCLLQYISTCIHNYGWCNDVLCLASHVIKNASHNMENQWNQIRFWVRTGTLYI